MDWGFAIGLAIGAVVGFIGGGSVMYSAFQVEIKRGWVVCAGSLYTCTKEK